MYILYNMSFITTVYYSNIVMVPVTIYSNTMGHDRHFMNQELNPSKEGVVTYIVVIGMGLVLFFILFYFYIFCSATKRKLKNIIIMTYHYTRLHFYCRYTNYLSGHSTNYL